MVNDKQSAVGSRRTAVFVYIVECADQTLYTGWTTNIERRLKAHNAGRGAKYTQQRGPVRVVYSEEMPDRGAALKRELQIKRMPRAEKLKLIEGFVQILANPSGLE